MTDHLTIKPHKYSFSYFFIEFASVILGIIIGGLVTVFLLFPKDDFPPSFYRPYASLGVVNTAKLLDEYREFLYSIDQEQSTISENIGMPVPLFFEHLLEAISHIETQKKITLFDAQKMTQLPDYTNDVRKYLPLPENPKDSHKKTTKQKEEDHP